MKRRITLLLFALFAINSLSAQISVSGLLDTSLSFRAGSGNAPVFSYGIENYANLRMTARLREMATVFADLNFLALSGDNAVAAMATDMPFITGENFIAGFDLERLYFRINTDNTRLDAGLTRIPFGHGFVWRPTDFLNPANPLVVNARPRGVLGAELSWWPTFDFKVVGFAAAPRNPFSNSGRGTLSGIMLEREWSRVVAKVLYSFESPRGGLRFIDPDDPDSPPIIPGASYGIHRAGLSIKADLELGFVLDLLYSYNHEQGTRLDGLSVSAGFDYTLFRGSLLVVAEYLFSGSSSSTSRAGGGHFSNEHYLFTSFTWLFNDFTNIGLSLIAGLSDTSFTPIATFNHALFQGATLTLTAQVPLDRHSFSGDGNRGELGPLHQGRYFDFTTMLRLRF